MPATKNLTRQQKFARMTSRWSPFPNAPSRMGAYDLFSQTIQLGTVTQARFEAAYLDRDFNARLEVHPLLIHEMQHFADHTSTVWGRELLVRLFNVYTARMSGKLAEYTRIPELMREIKTIHFDSYYFDITDAVVEPHDGSPWQFKYTTGFQLDSNGKPRKDRPIMFTQFTRPGIAPYICRVPLSIASLLEVRAIAAEMSTAFRLFEGVDQSPERLIDLNLWSSKISAIAYDPLMTEYTVAAHYFANAHGTQDFFETYKRAAAVAWVCLNLPRSQFASLNVPEGFADWADHWEAFRANADRGFLYACLVENGRGLTTDDMTAWLDQTLQKSGLPTLAQIIAAANAERQAITDDVAAGPYQSRVNDLLSIGMEYGNAVDSTDTFNHLFSDGVIPPVLLQESKFIRTRPSPKGASFTRPQDWFEEAFRLQNKLTEFVDACIV